MCLPVEKHDTNDNYSAAVVKVGSACQLLYSLLFQAHAWFPMKETYSNAILDVLIR